MKRKRPWLPLPYQDLLNRASYARLDAPGMGAFLLLVCHAWLEDDCTLPEDDGLLANWSRLGDAWPAHREKVMAAFATLQPYLLEERHHYLKISSRRTAAARRRWDREEENEGEENANALHLQEQLQCPPLHYPPSSPTVPSVQTPLPSSPHENRDARTRTHNENDEVEEEVGFENAEKTKTTTTSPRTGSVRLEDLLEPEAMERLRQGAISKGWINSSAADRLTFWACACHALAEGNDPPALFASIVSKGTWQVLTDEDDEQARALLKKLDRDPLAGDLADLLENDQS